MYIFLKQNTKDVESFDLELIFFFFFGGTILSRDLNMLLQILFCGCGTRKDLLMKKLFCTVNFAMSISVMKIYRGEKGVFAGPGSRIMHLTGWAENKCHKLSCIQEMLVLEVQSFPERLGNEAKQGKNHKISLFDRDP